LDRNERYTASVYIPGFDFWPRGTPQIKQSKSERRCKEARLEIDADHHAQPEMPPKALSTSQIEDLIAYFDRLGYWP